MRAAPTLAWRLPAVVAVRRTAAVPALVVAAVAVAAWAAFRGGYPNYDAGFAVLWGGEVVSGGRPDFEVPAAPTPHPLANALGALASLFGDGAYDVLALVVFLGLGLLLWAVYALGEACCSWRVGLLAAVVVATSESVLRRTGALHLDVPVAALLVLAAVLEVRRPRRGAAVLALLAVAGLQRPEAWLLTGAYLLYLWPALDRRTQARALALGAAAPVLWLLADLALTGDPLFSFTGTRTPGADAPTGGFEVRSVPDETLEGLRSILRLPVLLAACGGVAVALVALRRRLRVPLAVLALGLAASVGFGYLDLPVVDRFLYVPGAMLAIFFAVAAVGWADRRPAPPGGPPGPGRRVWTAGGIALTLAFLALLPGQADRLERVRSAAQLQAAATGDLRSLARDPRVAALAGACGPLLVQREDVVPLLADALGGTGREVAAAGPARHGAGVFVVADPRLRAANAFDLRRPPALHVPPDATTVAANASWTVRAKGCGPAGA